PLQRPGPRRSAVLHRLAGGPLRPALPRSAPPLLHPSAGRTLPESAGRAGQGDLDRRVRRAIPRRSPLHRLPLPLVDTGALAVRSPRDRLGDALHPPDPGTRLAAGSTITPTTPQRRRGRRGSAEKNFGSTTLR